MADVVGAKVHFDAVYAESALLDAHDGGAVDDDVDGRDVGPRENFVCGSSDGLLAGEVDLQSAVVDTRIVLLKDINAVMKLGNGATSKDEASRSLGCLDTVSQSLGLMHAKELLTSAMAADCPKLLGATPVMRIVLP